MKLLNKDQLLDSPVVANIDLANLRFQRGKRAGRTIARRFRASGKNMTCEIDYVIALNNLTL
ncbi:MAG: hypothetical protein VXZ82_17875 [Planctomycetota bacterium]|nr:hypothetical protein [Planctomycetota bacterium]